MDKETKLEAYQASLAGMLDPKAQVSSTQFMLGEAMISQKKLTKMGKELKQAQEILTELQIYVNKHQTKINSDLVDNTTLQIAIETAQTNLETRFDLAIANQLYKVTGMVEEMPTRKELSAKLADKLHKREFEK